MLHVNFAGPIANWLLVVPQEAIQLMPSEAGCIARAFVAHGMASPNAASGALQPLHLGLRKLQPSPEHLTPFHAAYLQACAPPQATVALSDSSCKNSAYTGKAPGVVC